MRRISLVLAVVALILMGGLTGLHSPHGVSAQDATPAAGDDEGVPPGLGFQPLAYANVPDIALPGSAVLVRITIDPGATFVGDATDPEFTLLYIESGEVVINTDTAIEITRAAMMQSQTSTPEALAASTDATLEAGDSVGIPPFVGGTLKNNGSATVSILLFNIAPGNEGEATPTS